jgi:hypothetical protein
MTHIDPIRAPDSLYRTVMDRENHRVTLTKVHHLGT